MRKTMQPQNRLALRKEWSERKKIWNLEEEKKTDVVSKADQGEERGEPPGADKRRFFEKNEASQGQLSLCHLTMTDQV